MPRFVVYQEDESNEELWKIRAVNVTGLSYRVGGGAYNTIKASRDAHGKYGVSSSGTVHLITGVIQNQNPSIAPSPGGEVWITKRQLEQIPDELLKKICPNGRDDSVVIVKTNDEIHQEDLLQRVNDPYCDLPPRRFTRRDEPLEPRSVRDEK